MVYLGKYFKKPRAHLKVTSHHKPAVLLPKRKKKFEIRILEEIMDIILQTFFKAIYGQH